MNPIKILFFDTETTGFLPSGRIVELWYIIAEYNDGVPTVIKSEVLRFKPYHKIPQECTKVHGITDDDVKDKPSFIMGFLSQFVEISKEVDYIVWHNLEYDMQIIEAECSDYLRSNPRMKERFWFWRDATRKKMICTMLSSVELCKIPGRSATEYKWPKLQELHVHLFWEEFDWAHWALADIEATARCFFSLTEKWIISIASNPFS